MDMSKKKREDYRTRRVTLVKARRLRRDMTEAEKRLWYLLRGHRFGGVKFKRQVPIGSYIVDFASVSLGLVIELDGGQHDSQRAYDARRTASLKAGGYRVIRFWNDEVFENLDFVLQTISHACGGATPPMR
jgi:very-short-patch-repair endonuclease